LCLANKTIQKFIKKYRPTNYLTIRSVGNYIYKLINIYILDYQYDKQLRNFNYYFDCGIIMILDNFGKLILTA